MNDLPRQTYLDGSDAELEEWTARFFADRYRARQFKIGVDNPDAEKPRIDRVLVRADRVTAFFEVKGCPRHEWGYGIGWATGVRKVISLRTLHGIVRVPCLFVVKFACDTVGWVDVMEGYRTLSDWGRSDRNDPGDREPGAEFGWEVMKRVSR
jgi:hypothetical protein